MHPSTPKAFIYLDTLVALTLVIILTAMTTGALIKHRAAQMRLADTRQAVRLAERVLVDLQLGESTLEPDPETRIGIERLGGGFRPEGRRWVRITVDYHGRRANLIGLTALNPAGAQP